MHRLVLIALGSCLAAQAALAEDWPQFRGPSSAGLTGQQGLPTEWAAGKEGAEKNIAWQAKLPGVAWSQPIVVGDAIFVTTAISENQPKPSVGGGGFGGGGGGGFGGGRSRGGPGGGRPGGGQPGGQRPPNADGDDDRPQGDAPPPRRGGFGQGGGRGFGGGSPPNAVYQWQVLCLDRQTGDIRWQKTAHEGKPTIPIHRTNTYASETPVSDGERVYAYFGMTGLFCYDLQGELLWSKDLGTYPMMLGWGAGSSPALDDVRVYVQCDNEQDSFIVAFDKRSGDEIWREKRDEKSNWCTPYLWKNKVRTELVTGGGTSIRSYDPATGKLLWELGGMSGRCSATPVGDADLLYVGSGGGRGGSGPLAGVRAGAEGQITTSKIDELSGVAWVQPRGGPTMASPLLYDGCLYVADQRGGIVGCYDAKTGEQHYRERLPGAKGFTSSPWAYDGKVFCLDEEGQTFVLKAGPEFEVLSTNKLEDMFWSSVAIADGRLLLRGLEKLYCIGK